jgi:hypothetical protein
VLKEKQPNNLVVSNKTPVTNKTNVNAKALLKKTNENLKNPVQINMQKKSSILLPNSSIISSAKPKSII